MSWADIEEDEIIQEIIEQEFMDSCNKKMDLMNSFINNNGIAEITIMYSIKGSVLNVTQFRYNDVNKLFSHETLNLMLTSIRFSRLVEFIGNIFGVEYSIYSAFYTMLILLREPKTINFKKFKPTSTTLIALLE
jgi:hypothetical protein